jgi:hypothetical protein
MLVELIDVGLVSGMIGDKRILYVPTSHKVENTNLVYTNH